MALLEEREEENTRKQGMITRLKYELEASQTSLDRADVDAEQTARELEGVRVSMARLKMLRLIHTRRIKERQAHILTLERRVAQLEASLIAGGLAIPKPPTPLPAMDVERSPAPDASVPQRKGGGGEDDVRGWRKKLVALEDEIVRLKTELESTQEKSKYAGRQS
ncbi:MAG: hypothetical protein SGPRY_011316 [Prymnesium sp.]